MKRRSPEASLAMPSRRSSGSAGRPFIPLLGPVDNGNEATLATGAERDCAVALGEDRVVAADARAGAGPEARPALAHDDRPRGDTLAVEDLDAEHLRVRVAAVPRRAESLLVSHLAVLPRFERGQRALAVAVRGFVLERRVDLLGRPVRRLLLDLRDRQVGVAVRQLRGRRLGLLLFGLRLGGRLLLRGSAALRGTADRLDLDLRELRAEAGLAPVARLGLVLADHDLIPQRGADDARRHLRLRRELELPVAAEHQHLRMEGLAFLRGDAVDEQALSFLDAVLLAAECDDCVGHGTETRACRPRGRKCSRAGRFAAKPGSARGLRRLAADRPVHRRRARDVLAL